MKQSPSNKDAKYKTLITHAELTKFSEYVGKYETKTKFDQI